MTPTFTTDWFSKVSPYWEYHVIPRLRGFTAARWLEVGSYEGRSALWTLENVLRGPDSKIDCVDLWCGAYEEIFDANVTDVGTGRLQKYKGKSAIVLPTLESGSYHGAYVDGSHSEEDVTRDLDQVWNLLRDGGVLVVDDYASGEYPDVRRAVDAFLTEKTGCYILLHKTWQVILVKSDARRSSFFEITCTTPFQEMLVRASLRISPRTIVDVGASDGNWSAMASAVWPHTDFLLVEANPVFEEDLRAFCAWRGPKFSHKLVLAAASGGEAKCKFHEDNPYQGVDLDSGPRSKVVQTAALDDLVASGGFSPPYLVKLDVHGQELPVLQGAMRILEQACAVVVEVYCWRQCAGSLRFWELCQYMEWLGFRPSDLTDPLYRPYDGRLCQVDMLFERIDAVGMNTSRYA